jgi:hypothetical protein
LVQAKSFIFNFITWGLVVLDINWLSTQEEVFGLDNALKVGLDDVEVVLVHHHFVGSDEVSDGVEDNLGVGVLLGDCLDDPVIHQGIYLLRVKADVFKLSQTPSLQHGDSVDQDAFFIVEHDEQWVGADSVVSLSLNKQLIQTVKHLSDHLVQDGTLPGFFVVGFSSSFDDLLGVDLSIELHWWFSFDGDLEDGVKLLDFNFDHLSNELANVSHLLDSPSFLLLSVDLLDALIFLVDNALPKVVAQHLDSLRELLLGLVILSQVWEL